MNRQNGLESATLTPENTNLARSAQLSNSRSSLNHHYNLSYHNGHGSNHNFLVNGSAKQNGRPSHHRTRSDTTGITNQLTSVNRCSSIVSLRLTIGDLMSGKAFDNNCNCLERQLQNQLLTDRGHEVKTILKDHVETSGQLVDDDKENGLDLISISQVAELNPCLEEMSKTNKHGRPQSPQFECACNAPRLSPEFEFTKSLISIGKKLIHLASKELKSKPN